ncbi:hypothetical protein JCM3766R1_005233 [Sporobolomyces carnicolor]
MPPKRISGLQRQVLHLYRRSLDMVKSKPLDKRPAFYQFVCHQFRGASLGGSVRKKDVQTIEYLLRKGERQLESYESDNVKNVVVPLARDGLYPLGWIAKGGRKRDHR